MHAVVATKNGFVNQTLKLGTLQPMDVQVQVDAVAINPHDVKAMTRLSGKQTAVYGFDTVGHIQAVGSSVQGYSVGQRILYSGSNQRVGAFADQHLVDSRLIALAPENFSDSDLAGLPLVGLTAYELLFEQLRFKAEKLANQGQRILVINGAGGVGSILTQLAHWSGLEVFATASQAHFKDLKANGVDVPIDYHQPFSEQISDSVDATIILANFDDYIDAGIALTKPYGQIGTTVTSVRGVNLGKLLYKSLTLTTEMVFTKPAAQINESSQGEILARLMVLLSTGELHPITKMTFEDGINASNLNDAARLITQGHVSGKLVILSGKRGS